MKTMQTLNCLMKLLVERILHGHIYSSSRETFSVTDKYFFNHFKRQLQVINKM